MQVNILYIINHGMTEFGLGHDGESVAVSTGLFIKHVDRCGAVGVFTAQGGIVTGVDLKHLKGHLPLEKGAPGEDKVNPAAAKELLEKSPANAQGKNRAVGVYIVSHGPADFAPSPDKIANSIATLLPADAKAKLHYVAVVACALADGEKDTEGSFDLNRADATYMTSLMKELNARQMRPVTAGWDVFISAAPHQPMTHVLPPKKPKPRKVYHEKDVIDVKKIPGRKFVERTSNSYQTLATPNFGNEYRKLHKHMYQVTNDNKVRVALGTWSSFTQ